MFFKNKCKIRNLVKIYTKLLDQEINECEILIHEVEQNKDNIPDKEKVQQLTAELPFLKGEVQSKIQVVKYLKTMLRNENLMDDWKAGTGAGDVNLRL